MLSIVKPNSALAKTQDFNQNTATSNHETKKLQEMFREVKNIYFSDLNKSPFLI